ncbi:hypothetical protein MUO83_02440 [Candidatus Bathyarchaeota archaeon]|nr:hypothetical protein [Candidatus Bathyarchaeota archaeon]
MVDQIRQTFMEMFRKTLEKRNPQWSEVAMIFSWLQHEASCARAFEHIRVFDDLRRSTESHFSQFRQLRKPVNKESRKVNEALKKRDEELRTTATRAEGKIPFIEGKKEREKVPPPE